MRFTPPPPKDSFHEETLFSCFVGKRVRDASINVSKKYRSSFYSRAVSVSAMQPCSASFNSLPLPREYNITNMTAAKRYESVWNAFLNELSHNPTATLTSFLKRCNVRQGRMKVSVSAMQPCSASFNSLPLPREYNITNMTAAKRYESVWNAFLNELSHNPTATLTSFLKRCNVRQGRMKRWMENNGLSVKEAKKRLRDCQHDGIGDPMSPLSEDSGSLFLPMATDKPAPRSESCDMLSGVSLTFPDGTQVNIKRGSAQAVMSFLKLYQREDLPCLD